LIGHTFSERSRHLFTIPLGVWHAVQNTGVGDATFMNMPDRAYDHAAPDKFRLPLKNDLIPFDFSPPWRGEQEGDRGEGVCGRAALATNQLTPSSTWRMDFAKSVMR
jgi:hypothetical protein